VFRVARVIPCWCLPQREGGARRGHVEQHDAGHLLGTCRMVGATAGFPGAGASASASPSGCWADGTPGRLPEATARLDSGAVCQPLNRTHRGGTRGSPRGAYGGDVGDALFTVSVRSGCAWAVKAGALAHLLVERQSMCQSGGCPAEGGSPAWCLRGCVRTGVHPSGLGGVGALWHNAHRVIRSV